MNEKQKNKENIMNLRKNVCFGTLYDAIWPDAHLILSFDTDYESDNGLNLEDPNYEEYWGMAFKIIKILKDDKMQYHVGDLIEINYHNFPQSITKKS